LYRDAGQLLSDNLQMLNCQEESRCIPLKKPVSSVAWKR
jgi:hypothetical protein